MERRAANQLSQEQVTKGVVALLKHLDNVKKLQKNQLLDEEDTILLIFSLFKIPEQQRVKPISIPLPNSLHNENLEICFFTKDPQKEYKEKFAQLGIKVNKVIGLSKLRKNYKPYEAKRQLCSSYDLFLADDRIIPSLAKILGNSFFKRKRQPIPINLIGNIKKEIEKATKSTLLFLNGACSAVKIGKSHLSRDQIIQNIMECTDLIVDKIPKKWKNIQSIHIKSTDSISLPIYNKLPSAITRVNTEGKKEEEGEEDMAQDEMDEEGDEIEEGEEEELNEEGEDEIEEEEEEKPPKVQSKKQGKSKGNEDEKQKLKEVKSKEQPKLKEQKGKAKKEEVKEEEKKQTKDQSQEKSKQGADKSKKQTPSKEVKQNEPKESKKQVNSEKKEQSKKTGKREGKGNQGTTKRDTIITSGPKEKEI